MDRVIPPSMVIKVVYHFPKNSISILLRTNAVADNIFLLCFQVKPICLESQMLACRPLSTSGFKDIQ